jgi:RNA polymerase sigma factor (sigma-70 family)
VSSFRAAGSSIRLNSTGWDVNKKRIFVAALAMTQEGQLRRYLLSRVRNPDDVPDLVQEVFLRLLRISDHEVIRSPEAYLFTVALHAAQQHSLRQATAKSRLEMRGGLPPMHALSAPDPSTVVSAEQSLNELEEALQTLTPKAQAAFLLHHRDGLTLDETAQRLGVSRSMIKKYLVKAMLHFRQRLHEAG